MGRTKTIQKKLIGIFIIMLMVTTILPVSGLAEEPRQNSNINNEKLFHVYSGVIIAYGVIYEFEQYYYGYIFSCAPVKKLTFIGIGGYNLEHNFNMRTFTNVTYWWGHTLFRKLPVSEDYQYFITFYNPVTTVCNFYTT
jgi:hypothetical protein